MPGQTDPVSPPISWWGQTWRVALCLVISAIVWFTPAQHQWHTHPAWFAVDLGVGIASYVAMFFRRRWPLPIALALNLAGAVSGLSAGPATLALVSLATRRVVWQVVLVGLVSVGAGYFYSEVSATTTSTFWYVTIGFGVAVTIATIAMGMYIGSRRELVWSLRDRAQQAEAQQELRIASARAAERERIAREMHDVLAHRISMVSMHAGALAFRDDLPAEQVRETAELIQSSAHQALTDLREVLGVLREDADGGRRDRPQPTVRDVPDLVGEAREAGMRVELAVDLGENTVPDQVGRTIYRIVQEGLTNARKHALGAQVDVEVAGVAGSGVDVWVRNRVLRDATSLTPGAGLGLVGLRERAELAGGHLETTREPGRFALHGWLPWPDPAGGATT